MNKYLEHPPVEAPFWDISNKLKYFGFSKGEFIKTKFTVKMSLRSQISPHNVEEGRPADPCGASLLISISIDFCVAANSDKNSNRESFRESSSKIFDFAHRSDTVTRVGS